MKDTIHTRRRVVARRSLVFVSDALILLLGVLVGACGVMPTQASLPLPTAQPAPETWSPPVAETSTIVDALGRSVQFAQLPERIVVAGKSTLTIVDALYLFPEAAQRLVGLVIGNQPIDAFLQAIDPTFDQKTILQVQAGPEQIAPLEPDVVLLRSAMAETLGKALGQVSIPVVYVDMETPDQFFRALVTLGRLLGNQARADEIKAYYQAQLDRVESGLQGLDDADKPRILIVQYTDQGGEVAFNVPPASWMQTAEAELARALPVWKEAMMGRSWTVVSLEQIAAWDPEQVFVISYKSDSAQIAAELKADPGWRALRATQDGQIHGFAGDLLSWDQPDPRWILGTIWLAGKLHPDRFADLDVMQQATEFFQQMYGMDEASFREIVPTLRGDIE